MRRRRKELSFKKIIILFVVCTVTFSVGYSLLSQRLSVGGTANLIITEKNCDEAFTSDLKINYDDHMAWHNNGLNYIQVDVNLTNISENDIPSWKIKIEFLNDIEISGSWAGTYELVDNTITITGLEYNKNITAGGIVILGFQVSTTDEEVQLGKIYLNDVLAQRAEGCDPPVENPDPTEPENPDPVDPENPDPTEPENPDPVDPENPDPTDPEEPTPVEPTGLNIEFTKINSWVTEGFNYLQYDIDLTNITDTDLNTWEFKFNIPADATIEGTSNCNYVNADGVVSITPNEFNNNLPAGASTKIGVVVKTTDADYIPTIVS